MDGSETGGSVIGCLWQIGNCPPDVGGGFPDFQRPAPESGGYKYGKGRWVGRRQPNIGNRRQKSGCSPSDPLIGGRWPLTRL